MKGDYFTFGRRRFFDSGHDGRYRVAGCSGVAWTVLGYEAEYDGEYEEWVAGSQLFAVMVGDDRPFGIDEDDLSPLKDSEYCSECGQIGCMHGAAMAEDED